MSTRVQLPAQFRALTVTQSVSTLGNALTVILALPAIADPADEQVRAKSVQQTGSRCRSCWSARSGWPHSPPRGIGLRRRGRTRTFAVLLTPSVVNTLHISVGWIGVIQSGDTVGNIVGAVTIAMLPRRSAPGR